MKAWQELLLAVIGEQLSLSVHSDDEVCRVSVRIRWDSDVIQIWNQDSDLKSSAKVRYDGCRPHLNTLCVQVLGTGPFTGNQEHILSE